LGITTYLFHKSNNLEKQRFNMFFLDIGENIHFHYRDLRIELSVGEFRELAELFTLYSRNVLQEIENGYQDGVLVNTNEESSLKTFWDKDKKLTYPVKYHEQQFAIEETADGYHLHIRNYKILLQKESFQHVVKAIASVLPLLEKNELERDPVRLLAENELATRLVSRLQSEGHEEIVIEIDKTFRNKAGQVLRAIGYGKPAVQNGRSIFCKGDSTVILVPPGSTVDRKLPHGNDTDALLNLPNFLAVDGGRLDAVQLNLLKLKILSLLHMARQGQIAPFRLHDLYINRETLNPAVDLFNRERNADPQEQLTSLNELLSKHKLFFVKPEKKFFSADKQDLLQDAFFTFVMHKLAIHECVRKIYVLGSSVNQRSGKYKVPFVHFDWAKLNSDFDIFIELDPDYDGPLPVEWEKKLYWPRAGCDYYHFGEIGDGMSSEYARQFPGIRFYDQLVEGYLFAPAMGDRAKKDKWFSEINARCIFIRDKIAEWLRENYEIEVNDTDRFNAASFNKVYHVFSRPQEYVLKIYESKHLTNKNKEKIAYEIGLLDSLRHSGLEVALPVKNRAGKYISHRDNDLAVLFTFIPGDYIATPNLTENMLAGNLLARFHEEARRYTTGYVHSYSNKQLLLYWLGAWQEYHDQGGVVGTDIALDIPDKKKQLRKFDAYQTHCHGDLSLNNFLFRDGKSWLIDFQNVGYGPALVDLANGMVEFSARKRAFESENGEAFKLGYESIRKLSDVENEFLRDLLIIQIAVRQAKLIRLHYGGFGYELKEELILGLRAGLEQLLSS
jgi:Ser/Thr protein kinase RdoA (MazF antagonist)